ncbi:MAG: tributyrin esterase [Planctomycetota bacterium]
MSAATNPDEAETTPPNDPASSFDKDSGFLLSAEDSEYKFSLQAMDSATIRSRIAELPVGPNEEDLARVELTEAIGQHSALMRLDHPARIRVRGSLGDYAFAFNAQALSKVFGDVGHGVADGMISGSVRVRGNAGHGAGISMTGGTLGIYGSAGDRVGASMRGGGIFVRGDVGDDVGLGAVAGTIVIGGDAGRNLGDPQSNVAVFLRGSAASLKDGVTEAPLKKKQEVQLGLILISAGIRGNATDFRRIVPIAMLEAEKAARGEVVPNWR